MKRLALVALGLAALAAPVSGQDAGVDRMLDSLAALWARADAAAIARYGAGGGVEMEVQGAALGPLEGRKMAAELRRMFENRETVRVVPGMMARVAGTDDRAFGELNWETRPAGATVPERSTVFVALVRERSGWRISQIRIFP